MNRTVRSTSFAFLCVLPFLLVVIAGVHAFRIAGVYQGIGVLLFLLILTSAWILGARAIAAHAGVARRMALAGTLFLVPWALISLLWVGIGAPFQATAMENHMRFLVLLANSILVAAAFVSLREAMNEAGERFYSTIGFAAALTAGTAYLLCISLSVAVSAALLRSGHAPDLGAVLPDFYSVLEFVACMSTYLATAAFAVSMGRVRWLARNAAVAFAAASAISLLLLTIRGVSYPELSANTSPWYTQPGVIVGIPAVPWIMPCLLGVVLLRRAGDQQANTAAQARTP